MNERVDAIKEEIKVLYLELNGIQLKCQHRFVDKQYRSNTGNYDPSCDKYWFDCYCPTCDKKWREELKES